MFSFDQALKIDIAMAKYLEEAPQPIPEDVSIPDVPQFPLVSFLYLSH